eukprot:s341_g9.t2
MQVHLPYLLHFLDSFCLAGMRDLILESKQLAVRGSVKSLESFPYHVKWQGAASLKARLLDRAGVPRPWWCGPAPQRPQSVHPKASRCEVEVDCSASDLMPPIAATASQSPSGPSGGAKSVQQRTSGWICDTLRELWRDEERRCLALGLPYPWTDAAPEPGEPGDGQGLTPDMLEECMMKQLHAACAGRNVMPKEELSSPTPKVAWSQRNPEEVTPKDKVSPKFAEACGKLEVAVSQRLPPCDDTATAALLDGGYERSEHEEEDAPTEHESDCGSTELDEEDNDGTPGSGGVLPTQLDATQATVSDAEGEDTKELKQTEPLSPLRPAQLFQESSVSHVDVGLGPGTPGMQGMPGLRAREDGAAKGFYSEPEDRPGRSEPVLEQEGAGVWEYWQAPPPFEVSLQSIPTESPAAEGEDVITRFDNAGRLTTLRRKVDAPEGKCR